MITGKFRAKVFPTFSFSFVWLFFLYVVVVVVGPTGPSRRASFPTVYVALFSMKILSLSLCVCVSVVVVVKLPEVWVVGSSVLLRLKEV